ncbi:uncharacterized protein LOC130944840 [Arachis stenosperma]|uniref:uncharacterized protein LOC130944840 n=1 Tax=Arachis stenosperma TaxID=217475 RepID=UPI0025AD0FDB|nr:uncharacterized protein LOC130944840 [Arachis stenosperma]XP_057729375.1 uncharacterized protein LOC130944840 [Arachis stenosperma]
MAIAGVHSVAVIDSTLLRESHSQLSGRRGDGGGRGGARSSSLLQMWREIEDEHMAGQVQGRSGELLIRQRSDGLISDLSQEDASRRGEGEGHMIEDAISGENESETWSQSQSQNDSRDDEHEGLGNSNCESSSDLGEVERERVRQIFREWMNSGAGDHRASNVPRGSGGSRRQWLGETEQERVSIIREWVQMSSQQRVVSSSENREDQSSEIGNQIERVRDGFVVNQHEGQSEHTRRGIRRLRGRQVLLDMLKKAEVERQREVQELFEHRAVSRFPHRNRIQALLRGRFLRNDRSTDNNRSTSIAESELGLLRQKQTVSGLREGFFSRKDNSGCSQATSNLSDASSDTDGDVNAIEHAGASSSQTVPSVHAKKSESNNGGSDEIGISGRENCFQQSTCENLDCQDSGAYANEIDQALASSVEVEGSDSIGQNVVMDTEDASSGLTQQRLQIEGTNPSNMQVNEVHIEQSELGGITDNESYLSHHSNSIEGNIAADVDWDVSVAPEVEQPEEAISENEGSDWHQTSIEWSSTEDGVDNNQLGGSSNELPQNTFGNEDGENSRLQEGPEVWQEDSGFQEAVEIWLGGPSDHEAAPVGRIHGFYFPEDDNVYSVELRELLSRRSVSNLLRSSFRESLDQLIQSYVERQSHANVEWELQETTTPFSPSAAQELEQQNRDPIVGTQDAVNSSLGRQPLPPPPPPPPIWDHRRSRHDRWSPHDINNQRLGMEWDVINDLRVDMVRLQQRMNNMQRMLETCMDMQLELQRSIRQEVSAALNRSTGSSGTRDHDSPDDKSKWECVRKGVCCICCENNIDSLLYRCGHMCTCSNCANDLHRSGRKCPMCQAPVVEVIRAYSIL